MTADISNLFLERLVVYKDGKSVYDQFFTTGINIIAGDNGTGKSTVANLIFYVLGGENASFNLEALSCDSVYAQINLSGHQLTLCRFISDNDENDLYIYSDTFDVAISDRENWLKYPYRRSKNKESFSELLFSFLGFPNCKTDDSANLTLYQILRLLYIDQMSSQAKIFTSESRYDTKTMRQAIGDFLLGIDDLELHSLRQKRIIANRKYNQVHGEVTAIRKFLISESEPLDEMTTRAEIDKLTTEISTIQKKIDELNLEDQKDLSDEYKQSLSKIKKQLDQLYSSIVTTEEKINTIETEIEDSTFFIETLKDRIDAITYSEKTVNSLGEVQFQYCPVCLTKIEIGSVTECHLCKSPKSSSDISKSYIRLKSELEFQLRESKNLMEKRSENLETLKTNYTIYLKEKRRLSEQYRSLLNELNINQTMLAHLSEELGYKKKALEDIKEKEKYFDRLKELENQKAEQAADIKRLDEYIDNLEAQRLGRREHVNNSLSKLTKEILRNDLKFEDSFQNPDNFEFYFADDKMVLDDRSTFSASSMVILKNAFRFSIFFNSLIDEKMRYPRFIICDNIEDKGMQAERSQNFQKIIMTKCEQFESSNYQLIYTTSMLDNILKSSPLLVGRYYEKGTHTLEL